MTPFVATCTVCDGGLAVGSLPSGVSFWRHVVPLAGSWHRAAPSVEPLPSQLRAALGNVLVKRPGV